VFYILKLNMYKFSILYKIKNQPEAGILLIKLTGICRQIRRETGCRYKSKNDSREPLNSGGNKGTDRVSDN